MCILVRNQNFEKQKKWNSKIPEPHLLLLESMKYVKKSGHGVEWVNGIHLTSFQPTSIKYTSTVFSFDSVSD
jgi:hypothetical protein